MDFAKVIDAARDENRHGVQVRGGKKYTTVAVRVEVARRHFGAIGIATDVIQWATDNGQPIVVKATVTDEAGRVLATGHAEEVRGQGNVNRTSALENAETSAIGRALAALGINGGEFASADEMTQATGGDAPRGQPQSQQQPETPESIRDRLIAAIGKQATGEALDALLAHPRTKEALNSLPHDMQGAVMRAQDERRKVLASAQEADHVYG
jgi:hypothetical protein